MDNNSQNNSNLNNDRNSLSNNPANNPIQPIKPQKKTSKIIITCVVVLLLIITGVITFLFVFNDSKQGDNDQTRSNQTSSKSIVSSLAQFTNDPLSKSMNSNGYSTGFLQKNKKTASSINFFMPKASAADISQYDPVVFYSGIDSTIFMLNTETKDKTEIVKTAGIPVFSSTNQTVAYRKNCSVYMINLTDTSKTETLIKEGKNAVDNDKQAICYSPKSWSPDGKKLAIIGLYSLSTEELGLVGFTDLYIYDKDTKNIEQVDTPEDFNNLYSLNWNSNNEITTYYTKFGKYASIDKEQLFNYSITEKKISKVDFNKKIDLETVQVIGDTIYALELNTRSLLTASKTDTDLRPIDKTANIGSFLVKQAADKKSDDLYLLNIDMYAKDVLSFSVVTMSDGSVKELFKPTAYSGIILGWGNNETEIIYLSYLSGKSAIYTYNISTNQNEILLDNLPLAQKF